MADTIVLPPSGQNLIVEAVGANTIPVSKIHTGAQEVDGGAVTPANPLPVGFQDGSGNSQQPQLRLINGLWHLETEDDLGRTAIERSADALEALLAIFQNTPIGDLSAPLAMQFAAPVPGTVLPPPSIGYAPQGVQNLTITIAGLATASARQSRMVNTGVLGLVDALVMVEVRSAAASTSTTGIVNVYAYGGFDATNFGDTVTGTDAAVTLTAPPNLTIIGTINVVANATTYKSNPMSVASAFGGSMPPYWGIVVENKSGATLLAAGPTYAKWLGVY